MKTNDQHELRTLAEDLMNAVQDVLAAHHTHRIPGRAAKALLHPIYRAIHKLDNAATALETEPEQELRAIEATKKEVIEYVNFPSRCRWITGELLRKVRQHAANNAMRALFTDEPKTERTPEGWNSVEA